MLYLGIDQHRKQLTVNVRDENGDVAIQRQVSTEWERVRQFFEQLAETAAKRGGFMAVVEVCGFNDWLLKLLRDHGCREAVLVQPETTSNKKTDRRDAAKLSQLLWVNRERLLAGKKVNGLRRVVPPSAADAQDRQLTALRKRLGQLRTQTLNRVQRLLMKHNLQQECPVKRLQTKAARKWLRELHFNQVDRTEMDLLLAQWEIQDRQIKELQEQIVQRQRQNDVAAIIATVPGMHAYSSLAVASRIGNIENFPRPGSLANYWGLTPGCRNSGDATARLGSITKQGSAMVRFVLGQVILHVLRRDRAMKAWYQRIKKRRGAKIAKVAAMRRLATILWHMVKHRHPYRIGEMMHPTAAPEACTTTPVQASPRTASEPASERQVFQGMAGQKNGSDEKQQKRPRPLGRPGPDGSFSRPGSAIPCRVAPQQSSTPFHRATTKIRT